MKKTDTHPVTPDGRYFVVRGRLWRRTNPCLTPKLKQSLVSDLMAARRAVRDAADDHDRATAQSAIDKAKRALGERGHVWWEDGAPDYNRCLAKNTPYAEWFYALTLNDCAARLALEIVRVTDPPDMSSSTAARR
jgi:hypothetical protein